MSNKINIVTFHNAYNYGAILQCIGLQDYLVGNKYNVNVLNYDCRAIRDEYLFIKKAHSPKQFIKNFIKLIYTGKNIFRRNRSFKKFINKNLRLTKLMNEQQIKSENFDGQTFIVGSDQVWNTKHTKGLNDIFTLNFSDNIKKISYAASIGKNSLSSDEQQFFKKTLSKFNNISVREETARNNLIDIVDKKIEVVLDPSFLLNKAEWWNKVENKERLIKNKYIFVYMPIGETCKIAEYLQSCTNYEIIYLEEKNIFKNNSRNVSWANPFDFLNLINYSEFVITSSFHATVFSIIFKKQFFVIPPAIVGSRITDLLSKLNLNDRICHDLVEFKENDYNRVIDYTNTFKVLEREITKSKKWLDNSLK